MRVFSGVSSGDCNNYALKRTAIENRHIYGKETAETPKSNFYVDDLFNFVEDEDNTTHLIKKVRSMCLESGFNLTKFCSYSKRILLSIPEEQELGVLWKMGGK